MRWLLLASFVPALLSAMAVAQAVQGPRSAVNFQNVNVCPSGQSAPQPCNRTKKLTYQVGATTTFGATNVVTQGVAKLDFTLNSTTCQGTLGAGSSCSVRVTFTPLAAGARMGAVELMDSLGNLLSSTYIYGNGQGPVAAFTPGTASTLPVSAYSGSAMTVDAAGNVYFGSGESVAKFDTRTGVQTTVATGVSNAEFAQGLAVDGAGNLFVSNNGLVKIAAVTGVQSAVGEAFNTSAGVAVDGRGNLYVGDDWDTPIRGGIWGWPRLAEVFAATGNQEILLSGYIADKGNPFINYPWGVAVDGAGNAYIATFNFGPVFESFAGTPPESGGGIVASRQFGQVGIFNNPSAVAVDAAGDVYVMDGDFDPSGIYEVAAGSETQTMVWSGPEEGQMAIDGDGNLFFGNTFNEPLQEVKTSVPAALNFGKVAVGSTSAPQSLTIQNIGNQALNAIPPGISVGPGFLQVPGSGTPADCTGGFVLAPGESCNLSIVFAPQAAGMIKATATFTDNALNKNPATQTVKLKGIGVE